MSGTAGAACQNWSRNVPNRAALKVVSHAGHCSDADEGEV